MVEHELKAKLTAYGADAEGIQERFLGDWGFYERCYVSFLADSSFEKTGQAIEAGDYRAAFDCAHSLKGLSANMGLTPLFDTVCILVESLRAEDYEDLNGKYDAVMSQLAVLKSYA